MTDKFTCYICGGKFTKALTDEEAKQQFGKEFPTFVLEETETEIVCDDCFKQVMGGMR